MDELLECGCWGCVVDRLEVSPEVEEGEVWFCVFVTKGCVYVLDVVGEDDGLLLCECFEGFELVSEKCSESSLSSSEVMVTCWVWGFGGACV